MGGTGGQDAVRARIRGAAPQGAAYGAEAEVISDVKVEDAVGDEPSRPVVEARPVRRSGHQLGWPAGRGLEQQQAGSRAPRGGEGDGDEDLAEIRRSIQWGRRRIINWPGGGSVEVEPIQQPEREWDPSDVVLLY